MNDSQHFLRLLKRNFNSMRNYSDQSFAKKYISKQSTLKTRAGVKNTSPGLASLALCVC